MQWFRIASIFVNFFAFLTSVHYCDPNGAFFSILFIFANIFRLIQKSFLNRTNQVPKCLQVYIKYFHNNLFALLKYCFSSWSSFRQSVKQRNNFLRYFSREKLTNDELYETRRAIQAKYYFLRYFFHGKVAQGWILKTYKATNTLLPIFEK